MSHIRNGNGGWAATGVIFTFLFFIDAKLTVKMVHAVGNGFEHFGVSIFYKFE